MHPATNEIVQATVGDLGAGRYRVEEEHPEDLEAVPAPFVRIATSNPCASPSDPAVLSLRRGGVPLARVRFLSGRASIDGVEVPILWHMDLLSAPAHRAEGVGGVLVRAALRHTESLGLGVAAVATHPLALAIYERLAVPTLGVTPRLVRLLRPGAVVAARVPRAARPLVAPAARAALVLARPWLDARLRAAARRFDTEHRTVLDKEIAPLLGAPPRGARGYLPADLAVANWRIEAARASDPRKVVRAGYLRRRRDGRLVGYTLTSTRTRARIAGHPYRDVRVTSLIDGCVDEREAGAHEAALRELVREARREEADVAEVLSNDVALLRAARRAGFVRLGGTSFSFRAAGGAARQTPAELGSFRVTMAAGDAFLF